MCLPSPVGILRFDYAQSMENDPTAGEKEFPFELAIIYLEHPNTVVLDYWCTTMNTQLAVTFEYKVGKFFLRKYGAIDCIPDNWDDSE